MSGTARGRRGASGERTAGASRISVAGRGPLTRPRLPRRGFPPGLASRSRRRPLRRDGQAARAERSRARCSSARAGRSDSALRQRASGRRRSAPRPEQGTSSSTRSNAASGQGGPVPSAVMTCRAGSRDGGARARASLTRAARCSWRSAAIRRAPASSARPYSRRALPPGPAHMSSQQAVGAVGEGERSPARSRPAGWLRPGRRPRRRPTRGAGSPPARVKRVGGPPSWARRPRA